MFQLLFALAMVGVAVVFATEAATYRWTAARSPTILAWIVGLLALAMAVEATVKLWRAHVARRGEGDVSSAIAAPGPDPSTATSVGVAAPEDPASRESPIRGVAFLAVVVLYTFTFRTVGFLPGSAAFLIGTMLVFRSTRPLYVVVATVLSLAVIYAVFVAFLRLPVPLWPRF